MHKNVYNYIIIQEEKFENNDKWNPNPLMENKSIAIFLSESTDSISVDKIKVVSI